MPNSSPEPSSAQIPPLDASQQDLLIRHVHRQLSEDETQELEHLLRTSLPARKFLEIYERRQSAKLPALAPESSSSAPTIDTVAASPVKTIPEAAPNRIRPSWFPWTAAVAGMVAIGTILGLWHGFPRSRPPVPAHLPESPNLVAKAPPPGAGTMVQTPEVPDHTSSVGTSVPRSNIPESATLASTPVPPVAGLTSGNAGVPPVQSMLNFSHTGVASFRAAIGLVQTVSQATSLGFTASELRVVPTGTDSSVPGQPIDPPAGTAGSLWAVDYGSEDSAVLPFKLISRLFPSPGRPGYQVLIVGVEAVSLARSERAPANLAFLIDVSDSMADDFRLPMLKAALLKYIDQLNEEDRLGIVEYGGAVRKLLPSTSLRDRAKINTAIYSLQVIPNEVRGAGLSMAYDIVQAHFLRQAVNRVVVMTDGDLSFGPSLENGLLEDVDRQYQEGIGLSLIGVGPDLLSQPPWRTLLETGHGTYTHVSSEQATVQALRLQTAKTPLTTVRDVRVEFAVGPDQVKSYRLLGYENQWPQNPSGPQDFHIFSAYEILPVEGGLSAHPIRLQARYRVAPGATYQTVTQDVLDDSSHGLASEKIQEIWPQVAGPLSRALEAKSAAAEAIPSRPSPAAAGLPPAVVENSPIPTNGQVQPEDYRQLQEQAQSWMDSKPAEKTPGK